MEYVAPALACVHQSSLALQGGARLLAVLSTSTLFGAKSCWTLVGHHYISWIHTEKNKKMDKHKGNQQILSAWALRNIIGPNHHLFSIVKPLTAGLDKAKRKVFWVRDVAKTLVDQPPIEARCLTQPANFDKWHDDCRYTSGNFVSTYHTVGPV